MAIDVFFDLYERLDAYKRLLRVAFPSPGLSGSGLCKLLLPSPV